MIFARIQSLSKFCEIGTPPDPPSLFPGLFRMSSDGSVDSKSWKRRGEWLMLRRFSM